jgi:hypothetical protein
MVNLKGAGAIYLHTYLKEVSPGAKGAQKNSDKWPPVTRHRHTPTQQPTNTPRNTPNTEHRTPNEQDGDLFYIQP